jgi:hypothetical protein
MLSGVLHIMERHLISLLPLLFSPAQNAMNEINSSKRLKFAIAERAEGDKILQVKAAEAEAEAKYLSGVGVSKQRKAIVDGLRESIVEFSEQVEGAGTKDVMDLLLLTQYFDMIRDGTF